MNSWKYKASCTVVPGLLLPFLFGCEAARPPDQRNETVVSDSLQFRGEVVDVLPSGQEIRETAIYRGREFRWTGKLDNRVATPELEREVESEPLRLDEMNEQELAEDLRGLALFGGHQFLAVEPAYGAARAAKEHYELLERGASAEEIERRFPGTAAGQGTAGRTADFEAAEEVLTEEGEGAAPRIVHGDDDRFVLDNLVYPHRAQIVFDNAGSTSTINGSQGSGSLIGRSTAMSVAHVFWDEVNDTWEADHRWAPGFDSQDGNSSPWGEWYRCYWVTIPVAYTTNENQNEFDFAVIDFDVGCNSTNDGVNSDRPGATVGWLGHYTASAGDIETRTAYVRGYPGIGTCGNPGQQCNVRVWGDISLSSENEAESTEIRHDADTTGGQSGSAIYHYADPGCGGCDFGSYLVGMHRVGGSSTNGARRYTSSVYAFVQQYSGEF
jgi:V8-like Glu-specific endopeptidase